MRLAGRTMCEQREGWIHYPWQNPGDDKPRRKIVRYLYYKPWDWIVAVGSYEDEFYHETNLIKDHILKSLGWISLGVGLVATLLVFLAAKVLSDPIRHMIEASGYRTAFIFWGLLQAALLLLVAWPIQAPYARWRPPRPAARTW